MGHRISDIPHVEQDDGQATAFRYRYQLVSIEPELNDLLGHPGTRLFAFEPSGGWTVPLPNDLVRREAVELSADGPLDMVAPDSQSRAVVAFERARRHGWGTVVVRLVGDEGDTRLDVFDQIEQHGCFVAVLSLARTQAAGRPTPASLAPRRAVHELNVTGVIVAISSEFTAMLGWADEEVVGLSSLDLVHPDDHEAGIVAWVEMLETSGSAIRVRQRWRTSRNDWLWCEETNHNYLEDPDRPTVRCELLDVSREMAAQAALQRRETLLNRLSQALPTGVLYLDTDGQATVCNERWTKLTGLLGSAGIRPLLHQIEERDALELALDRVAETGEDADLEISFLADGAGPRYGEIHLRPLREGEEDIGLLVTLDDVTSMRSYQNELADQIRHDHLTSVRNRLGIEEALEAKLEAKRVGSGNVALLFVDLDRFKAINDTHGHVVGDQVLQLVADHIGGMLRPEDALGRVGGDEFIVVLGGHTSPADAERVVDRIRCSGPCLKDQMPVDVHIGFSVGLAFAEDGDDFDSLLKRADATMYRSKHGEHRLEQDR